MAFIRTVQVVPSLVDFGLALSSLRHLIPSSVSTIVAINSIRVAASSAWSVINVKGFLMFGQCREREPDQCTMLLLMDMCL